jgi:ABC-2 type transport system ATP-binding protein
MSQSAAPIDGLPSDAVPQYGRIVATALTKVFGGRVRAVDHLSFSVEPGSVTGFLGPNGAGKTTTLRMLLGLVKPTSGSSTINGVPYHRLDKPLTVVGAALESSSFHPARSGRNHLRVMCAAAGLPDQRADEVLNLVGLRDAGKRKVRAYSMGMRQRLGLAAALIGNPHVLVLDEPANGLDPEGIVWLRSFFRQLAAQGRTVLVSSHQLNEVQEFADRVVILDHGRLIRSGSIAELTAGTDTVVVRTPQGQQLADALSNHSVPWEATEDGALRVRIDNPAIVGHLAFQAGVELHELRVDRFDLEQLFFSLTRGEFAAADSTTKPDPERAP